MLKKIIKFCLLDWLTGELRSRYSKRIEYIMKLNQIPSQSVAHEKMFLAKWKQLSKKVDLNYYRCYSHYIGTDINIMPEDISANIVEPLLNPVRFRSVYGDKNMFDKILPESFLPQTLLRNINGFFYDRNYQRVEMSSDKVLLVMLEKKQKIVIKPSVDSESGRGVFVFMWCAGRFETQNGEILSLDFLEKHYRKNYIIQECLQQHSYMSHFNSTSVNTFRVFVYRSVKTDEIIVPQMVLRIGKKGSNVDNAHRGGIVVGIQKNGKLNQYATTSQGVRYSSFNDFNLQDNSFVIPWYDDIIDFSKKVGKYIIHHRMLALDVMIDDTGMPRLIEYNISGFGVWIFQFNSAPVFCEYTDEVIEYCVKHRKDVSFCLNINR